MKSPVKVQPIRDGLFFFYWSYTRLIVAGVAVVLLVACVNLATLFLARGRSREQDVAIRAALGASTGRLVRPALVEASLLCLTSAAVAIAVCYATFQAILALVPATLRGVATSPVDPRVVVITIGLALITALLAGGLPALRAAHIDVVSGLKRSTRSTGARLRGGATLLAIETALGLLLVTGAALTVRNFVRLITKDQGYAATDLYQAQIQHGFARDQQGTYTPERVQAILDVVRGLPGIEAAGATGYLPVGRTLSLRDQFWQKRGLSGLRAGISGGFFGALHTPMVAGREFTDNEVRDRALLAIVNVSGSRNLWPDRTPAEVPGQSVETADGPRVVVGVAADLTPLPGIGPSPSLFVPMTAPEAPVLMSAVVVAMRVTHGRVPDSAALVARLNDRFGRQFASVTSVADALPPQLQQPKFQAVLFGAVAVIALVLAAIGLYAVAAFDVARRRFEISVRLSLGATGADIRRLVIRGAVRPVLAGAVAGLIGTWWAAQYLQSFLFEVNAEIRGRSRWS